VRETHGDAIWRQVADIATAGLHEVSEVETYDNSLSG